MTEYSKGSREGQPMSEADQDATDRGAELAVILIEAIGKTSNDDRLDGRVIAIGMGGAIGSFFNEKDIDFKIRFLKHFFDTTIQFAEVPLTVEVKQ